MCKDRFRFGETILENVQSYTYLGIVINSSGTLNAAKHNMRYRALKAVYTLKSCIRGADLNPELGLTLFDQLIKLYVCMNLKCWAKKTSVAKNTLRNLGLKPVFTLSQSGE
jgi:hypothetical protein